jgi:hypothetical protein
MKGARLLILVPVLLALASVPTAAAPLSDPCPPGTAYHPACDVDDNGVINIDDIMRTAGRWLTSGPAASDNNHTHLGQIWNGSNNLKVQGTYAYPSLGALELSNSAGNGLGVASASGSGLHVYNAGSHGFHVHTAGAHGAAVDAASWDGLHVGSAGLNGLRVDRAENYGVYIDSARHGVMVNTVDTAGGAMGTGLTIGSARFGITIGSVIQEAIGISQAGYGVIVRDAAYDGISVYDAGEDGVEVGSAGMPSQTIADNTRANGLEVQGAQGHGVFVGHADVNGVQVQSASYHGLYVGNSGQHGVKVDYPVMDGIFVNSAGENGVSANTSRASGEWGLYTPDKIRGSNVTLSSVTIIAQVAGETAVSLGDVVTAVGVADPLPDSTIPLALVHLADTTIANGIVGIVEGRMALAPKPQHEDEQRQEPVLELRSAEGPAQPGDYVAITVLGVAQVKVQAGEAIQPGQRLTVAANGRTRPVGTVKVQLAGGEGTADIAESAPVIGVALEPSKDGLVWVLVNPQ